MLTFTTDLPSQLILNAPEPTVILFTAQMSLSYRVIQRLKTIARVFQGAAQFFTIDGHAQRDLARHYEVTHLPTVMLVHRGAVQWHCVGMLEHAAASELKQQLVAADDARVERQRRAGRPTSTSPGQPVPPAPRSQRKRFRGPDF